MSDNNNISIINHNNNILTYKSFTHTLVIYVTYMFGISSRGSKKPETFYFQKSVMRTILDESSFDRMSLIPLIFFIKTSTSRSFNCKPAKLWLW